MEYIEKYFSSIFYLCKTYTNPNHSATLKSTIRTDLTKTMMIGAMLLITFRFCISTRYYLLKDYVKSGAWGCLFGMAYSPYFLSLKIDE